jgi:hypothetical protein
MKKPVCAGAVGPLSHWRYLLFLLLLLSFGCQAPEPPLSPGAATFKKEVQECIDRLATPLVEPLSKKDIPAINETLKKAEPQAIKLCRMCPFRIGVLDKNGETLTVYPYREAAKGDFSGYEVVVQTLKNRKTLQQRFFMQDGSEIYIVCVPILKQEELLGVLALALGAEEAKKIWGVTEKEFLAIDFNR